ncbi:putative lipid II flippase FtsW [Patescibacteria group bacterium]|nr:putative lipid II flippase FtsW [Patescibacteria group bacterium]
MGKKNQSLLSPSAWLISLVLILTLAGLLFVFNASVAEAFNTFGDQYHFLKQHLTWIGLGLLAMILAKFIPLSFWKQTSKFFYIFGLLALLLVFIPGIGREFNGAHRWIFWGNFRFQPVEPFKLAMIVFFANWMSNHQKLLPFLFTTGLPALLILLQPDLGSLLVIVSIAFGMFFIAGGKLSHLLGITGISVLILLIVILGSGYRRERLSTFLNPQADPLGAGFHIRQITLALGQGGWLGQGIGNSRQKFSYIPEASTDSIFAIIAEEIGFIGSVIILALFALYFYFATKTANLAPNSFERLLGWGIIIWLAAQTLLNLAAVVALVPLTGLPLPFLSYGGSSLVMILLANGILLRISAEYNK